MRDERQAATEQQCVGSVWVVFFIGLPGSARLSRSTDQPGGGAAASGGGVRGGGKEKEGGDLLPPPVPPLTIPYM